MKKIYFLLTISLLCSTGYGQDKDSVINTGHDEFRTIFGGKTIGGYGAVDIGYSQIDNKEAVTFGARGGVILGHSLAIGFGGRGFANAYQEDPAINKQVNLMGGYGGFFIEPILLPRLPIHLSFPVMAGLGGVAYTSWVKGNYQSSSATIDETSVYMFVEPAAELEFNLTDFFRLAAFISYRFTSPLDLSDISPNALEYYNAGVIFKFGKF